MPETIEVFADAEALAAAAAGAVIGWLKSAVEERGEASLSLAGGSTPAKLHQHLAAQAPADLWPKVSLYFGDERAVGPEDEDSNYRMAKRTLLDALPSHLAEHAHHALVESRAQTGQGAVRSMEHLGGSLGRREHREGCSAGRCHLCCR